MAYGTPNGVAARVPSLRLGQANSPDEFQVETWLTEGAVWIDRTLAASGYTVPVDEAAALHTELVAIGEQYAAAQALRARGLDAMTGGTEDRSTVLMREVTQRLNSLAEQDLTAVGLVLRPLVTGQRNRRLRSVQMRRMDGYSGARELGSTEWSGITPPSD
jgi:hypothetical protein